jgi:hypothetical protein
MRVRMPRSRPSPAMIVALLALFVALGGSAAAAFVVSSNNDIGPNTVAGGNPPSGAHSNIIAGSVAAADIKPNSIGSGRILDNSLTGTDIADGSVSAVDIKPSTIGTGRVADDSLTGADIDESTLGQVPSAASATTLGGHPAGDFAQGAVHLYNIATTFVLGGSGTLLDMPGFARIDYFCNADETGQYGFGTGPAGGINVFFDNGGADPSYLFVGPNSSAGSSFWATNSQDGATISLQGPAGNATAFLYNRVFFSTFLHQTLCAVQGQVIGPA